jgi:hypothetical protein
MLPLLEMRNTFYWRFHEDLWKCVRLFIGVVMKICENAWHFIWIFFFFFFKSPGNFEEHEDLWKCVKHVICVMWNCTDISAKLCRKITDSGLLQTCIRLLTDVTKQEAFTEDDKSVLVEGFFFLIFFKFLFYFSTYIALILVSVSSERFTFTFTTLAMLPG